MPTCNYCIYVCCRERNVYLEASRAPLDELNCALGLNCRNGRIHVLRHDIAAVQQAHGHVLAVARVALDHLVGRLEARVGDIADGERLVVRLLRRHHRTVCGEREVNARVRHEICLQECAHYMTIGEWSCGETNLELGQIDVECTVEAERRSDRGDDLKRRL